MTPPTVLLVEDEPAVRELCRLTLTADGCEVLEAGDASAACRLAATGRIDLLVTDVSLPGVTGPQLAERLAAERPGLKVLYLSGYPREQLAAGHGGFLQKPFGLPQLRKAVREQLAGQRGE